MNEQVLGFLGLMRRAGALAVGAEDAFDMARENKARILMTASDSAANTVSAMKNAAAQKEEGIPLVKLECTKRELGAALGVKECAALAVLDTGFALALCQKLELEEGERVITISRLRLVNNEPCMVEVMNFPYRLVPGLEKLDLNQSIYHLLKDNYQCEVIFAQDVMEPIIIGEYESKLLELTMPSAGMRTYRTGRDANQVPIEYSTHIIPGKKCTMVFDHAK